MQGPGMAAGWLALAFLAGAGHAGEPAAALAAELFAESNFPACRLECARALRAAPGDAGTRLLLFLADAREGRDVRGLLNDLADDPETPGTVAGAARYEWARAMGQAGDWRAAFEGWRQVFETTDAPGLSVRAGCSLALLMRDHPDLARAHPALVPQVRTLRALYTPDMVEACRLDPPRGEGWAGLPGQWFITFYRSQIRPAIGERCSLVPSCSEYARQAFRRHGLLGVPLVADRLVREPGVVAAGEPVLEVGGKRFYADPLADHDGWMEE